MVRAGNKRICIKINGDIWEMFESIAKVEMRTLSNLGELAISEYITRYCKDETHRQRLERVCGATLRRGSFAPRG